MSELTCSRCKEVRDITGRLVPLPFVCFACQNVGAGQEGVQYQLENSQPAELTDETSTTQATIEMIQDIEAQLALAREVIEAQTEVISSTEKINSDLQTQLAETTLAASSFAYYLGFAVAKIEDLERDIRLIEVFETGVTEARDQFYGRTGSTS